MKDSAHHLLLVGDDPQFRSHLLQLCEAIDSGVTFELCTQARQAHLRLASGQFSACLLPADSQLLQQLRHCGQDCLLLVIGQTPSEVNAELIDAGADELLVLDTLTSLALQLALATAARRHVQQQRLMQQARQDPLTGLANRARMEEELERLVLRSLRIHQGFVLLYIDLDFFKQINDSFGHGLGDLLLSVIANRLRRSMRAEDLVARIGGDEFVALLAGLEDLNDAALIAAKIINSLSEPVTLSGHHLLVSASIGIAAFPQHGQNATELLQHADQALYQAKAQGRNGYQVFSPEQHDSVPNNLRIEQELRKALLEQQFELYYQPIQDARSSQIIALEALLRWKHPRLGVLAPSAFLAQAEHAGLILPIGQLVLQMAAKQQQQWQAAGLPVQLAINLSERELRQPRLCEQLQRQLEQLQVIPQQLRIELREALLLKQPEFAQTLCEGLAKMGCDLWLDNFGDRYGALGFLAQLPIKGIKLDSRVLQQDDQRYSGSWLTNLIGLAHSVGKQVVAGHVENASTASSLTDWGADQLQGYWIGKPQPLNSLLAQLSETTRSSTR